MATTEQTVLSVDLQPGDILLTAGNGGFSGTITRVHVDPEFVRVDFGPGDLAILDCNEVCLVRRTSPATVHPLFQSVFDAHFGRGA